jgi:hypothetical protein
LWSPIPQPQHLLLAAPFQRNLFGESASIQVGMTRADTAPRFPADTLRAPAEARV